MSLFPRPPMPDLALPTPAELGQRLSEWCDHPVFGGTTEAGAIGAGPGFVSAWTDAGGTVRFALVVDMPLAAAMSVAREKGKRARVHALVESGKLPRALQRDLAAWFRQPEAILGDELAEGLKAKSTYAWPGAVPEDILRFLTDAALLPEILQVKVAADVADLGSGQLTLLARA